MIPLERIAQLAELFDRYNNALDPLAETTMEAKVAFEQMVDALHTVYAADIDPRLFRYELIKQCREYLRKNKPP
jgi:hypothetical protein